MEDPEPPGCNRSGRFKGIHAPSRSLAANQPDRTVIYKMVKAADRIGTAADTGQNRVRKASLLFQYLFPDLPGDDSLEIPDDRRKRMRTHHGTEAVMRVADALRPLPHRFRNRIL